MAANETEHQRPGAPINARAQATILAFRQRPKAETAERSDPKAQTAGGEQSLESYANNVQAREFSIFDVFVMGAVAGGVLVYLGLNYLWSDRFFVRADPYVQLESTPVQTCSQCDRVRPWLSPY
ncbi:hypothetical protein [Rhizobium sp. BE258]|uniref:hypothetical protein n=1 Tax=Rhizobium sp. BE258 TaxID=2817722 RepID=UPI000DD721C1|nr:hypothetical protein [Rhizobium sp. BE258]MDR7145010.1 hypothetical protein [Rhizobium sp. BE258]